MVKPATKLRGGVLLLALLCAFSFSAIVTAAFATEYHSAGGVYHGWVAGSSASDGSFFSRVEPGAGSMARNCDIYNWYVAVGGQSVVDGSSTCNAWSRDYGNYTECASYAKLTDPVAFSQHNHTPDDFCA